jgi:hypothetical protein
VELPAQLDLGRERPAALVAVVGDARRLTDGCMKNGASSVTPSPSAIAPSVQSPRLRNAAPDSLTDVVKATSLPQALS